MQLGASNQIFWRILNCVKGCASIQANHKNLWAISNNFFLFFLVHRVHILSPAESPRSWSGLQTWASILSASLPAPTSSRKGPRALWLPGACRMRCWGRWANDGRMRSNWYCPGRRETNPVAGNGCTAENSKHRAASEPTMTNDTWP